MMRTLIAAACAVLLILTTSCGALGGGKPDVPATVSNMDKLAAEFYVVMSDDKKKMRLKDSAREGTGGAGSFGVGVKNEVFDPQILEWLVIPGTGDSPASLENVRSSGLTTANCGYCMPKLSDLLAAMSSKNEKRCVMLCPNSRHWKAFGESVPVVFSDENRVTLVKLADLSSYGITQADWDDPAGKLFGKKAPFNRVYE